VEIAARNTPLAVAGNGGASSLAGLDAFKDRSALRDPEQVAMPSTPSVAAMKG
jgi:hypothetical protein